MNFSNTSVLHPASEVVFSFPTYGGNVRLCPTGDALTPFGGVVPWAAFQKRSGVLEGLAATCPVKRTSPNAAPVYDILTSFGLTVLCDGRRFAHVQRLREDPTLDEVFGLGKVVSDDTLRRFMARVPEAEGGRLGGCGRPTAVGSAARQTHSGLGFDGADQIWPPGGSGSGLQSAKAGAQEFSSLAGRGCGHTALSHKR